eukprot:TRINITY_DN48420_c0_g1_i1.p1 TRINITY_DN48420_c0_g1~~TRINITY_DN48420_c0_g1_i1.p1  ORF type:complete len:1827 (-),score=391.48 TRINITY_DN48420_c0_g1_i1:35-5437(-)
METLGTLFWPYKGLPDGLRADAQREASRDLEKSLGDLRKKDASPGFVSYALRCLDRVRDFGRTPVERHVDVALELWRLLQDKRMGYRVRRNCASALHRSLRNLRKEFTVARGMNAVSPEQGDMDSGPLAPLKKALSWRVVQAMVLDELEITYRGAGMESQNHSQHFAEALVHIVNELRHWTEVSEAAAVVESMAPWLDSSQRSIILFGRMMLMSLPAEACEEYVRNGRFAEWSDMLPQGANARFALMWIALPARAAKVRWASGEPASPTPLLTVEQLGDIMDVVAGVMSLPVDEGKSCDMDHFADDCQWAFLGKTLYRVVAKFLVYSLEPLTKAEGFPTGSMWASLEQFCRRLAPCMIHAGSWTWHVHIIIFELTKAYYLRICRERYAEPGCTAHPSLWLTPSCDDAFVRLLHPLLVDALSLQSSPHLHSVTAAYSILTRVSLFTPERWEEVRAFLQESVQDLEDPMSARHSSTLQLLTASTPVLVCAAPGLMMDAAHLALAGINGTDPMKTLLSAAFFVSLFVQVPTMDLSARDLPDKMPFAMAEVLPVHAEGSLVPGASAGDLMICTSTMPDLCRALLDKFLGYVQAMPKPSKRDAMASLDIAGPRILSTGLFLAARQADEATVDTMVTQFLEWLDQTLLPSAVKGSCMLVAAFSLTRPALSARFMDRALERLAPVGGLASLGEPQVIWRLSILGAAARFGAAGLPPRQAKLEAVIREALKDSRKAVRKAGAKVARRVLNGLTDPFTGDLVGPGDLNEALLRWSGARGPQLGPPSPVEFHVPTAEELAFADGLCRELLELVKKLAEGSDEDIHTALSLAKSIIRGIACAYPDERTGEDVTQAVLGALPNTLGPLVHEELCAMLLSLCPRLGSPCHPLDSNKDTLSRPKLLCKALRMVVGVIHGERRAEIPDLLQIRGFDGDVRGRILAESVTDKVHYMAVWRDISRVWYQWEVLIMMNRRMRTRATGFKFEGVRRKLAELLCNYTVHENSLVSCLAAESLHGFLRMHYGAKHVLLEKTFLPLQETTIARASTTPQEQSHLAEAAMQGFATAADRIFVAGSWKKSTEAALSIASSVLRTIHAFTEDAKDTKQRLQVRPAAVSIQFELLSKWCSAKTAGSLLSPGNACRAAGEVLAMLGQPGIHWRTRVCVLSVAGIALRIFHFTDQNEADLDPSIFRRWLTELVGCFAANQPPQLTTVAAGELTAALRSAMRRPTSLIAACLKEVFPSDVEFLDQVTKSLAGLHQGHMGGDGAASLEDTVQTVVRAAVGRTGVPHLAWAAVPSSRAWNRHTVFFQSYVSFRSRRGDTSLMEDLRTVLARLQAQPKSEAEDHVVFVELLAGTLRAARRWRGAELAALWAAVGPSGVEELRSAEEDNVRAWQFLVAFALNGVSRRLRPKAGEPSEDAAVLRLASFLARPPGDDGGSVRLEALDVDGEGEATSSSHSHVTRLRLLQVLFINLRRQRPAFSDELRVAVFAGVVETLKQGVAHPYKQVHEGSAKSLVLILLAGVDHQVVHSLRAWLQEQAAELGLAVRKAPKDSSASVLCKGLVYCFVHGLLGRQLRDEALTSAELLLAAVSAEDHELRALAGLALRCLGQSSQRSRKANDIARALAALCSVPEGVSDAPRARRLEAAVALLGAGSMRHHFALRVDEAATGEGTKLCRERLVGMLKDERIEVRIASQNALAPLLGVESQAICKKQVKFFRDLPVASVGQAVHGLGALLSAAGSLGVPSWLGSVVEALASVGRQPEAKKEAERVVQTFLKQQQQSRDLWKRCQARLSSNQMELLKARQGTMSYYS